MRRRSTTMSVLLSILFLAQVAGAETIAADPSNYWDLLNRLVPGDTLELAPGQYTRLTLRDLEGTSDTVSDRVFRF